MANTVNIENININVDNHNEDRENLCHYEHSQLIETILQDMRGTSNQHKQQQHQQHQHQHQHQPPAQSQQSLPLSIELPPPYSTIPGTVPLYIGRRSGPPPSYEDVVNPDAPPPSYHSLFGQVREARKSANGFIDFLRKVILLILGTLGCTVIIGFTVVIPFTMIIIGLTYMNECPVENIPTFLLVGGIVWMFKNIMNCWATCKKHPTNDQSYSEALVQHRKNESLLNCFLFGWFVAGCVLVFRIYEPNYDDPSSSNYCHRTVYMYAFWLIASAFIIFGLFIGCLCCLTISSVFANNDENN